MLYSTSNSPSTVFYQTSTELNHSPGKREALIKFKLQLRKSNLAAKKIYGYLFDLGALLLLSY